MRFFTRILAMLAMALSACNGSGAAAGEAQTAATRATKPASTAPPAVAASGLASSPYEVRGLLDPGLNDLVPLAFLAPKGWLLRQGLRRLWQGAVPSTETYAALTSPDGRSSLEFLPEVHFYFTDWRITPPYWNDPVEHPVQPRERYPLAPLIYLRHELLPQLTKLLGQPVRLTAARGDSVLPTSALPPRATAAVEGVLPSGRRFQLTTEIRYYQTKNLEFTSYQWAAYTTLAQTDTALATCATYGRVALQSLVLNPAWMRQQQLLTKDGLKLDSAAYQSPTGIPTRPLESLRLLAPPSAARAYQRQRAKRPTAQPEIAAQSEYAGPARPVPVADSASGGPVYRLSAGEGFTSNKPLDPNRVEWVALQRRETARYRRPLPTLQGRRLMLAPPLRPPARYRFSPSHY